MARQERYFIGPSLLSEIRGTITRVDAIAPKTSGAEQPVRLQDLQRPGGAIKACTFTGSWNINETKTLTFQSDTSRTVVATNQLFTIGDACETQVAYIGRVSSPKPQGATASWHLLNVQHHETAFFTSVTLTTAALEFTRILAWVPYPGQTSTMSITLATATSCS
jgi:hypothetical protein